MWVLHIIAYNTVIEPIVLILFGFAIHFIYIATFAVSFSFNIYYYCVCYRCFSFSPSFYPNSNMSIYLKFFSPHNISNSWNEINTIINFESFFLIFLLLIFAWWQFTVQDYHQNCSRFQHICCYFHILDSKFCASII